MKLREGAPVLDARIAEFRAESFDEGANTIDVVFTTGARVLRRPWFGESFIEELDTDPSSVRLDRLNGGAPFLDSHRGGSLSSVLGVVVRGSAKMADGEGTATVRLSREEEDQTVVNKIRDGIIANVSVGYEIHQREITEATPEGGLSVQRITDWEPFEISAVPMGADPDAHIRSMYAVRGFVVADLEDAAGAGRQEAPGQEPKPTTEATQAKEASEANPTRTQVPTMTPEEIQAVKAEAAAEALKVDKARRAGIATTVRALGSTDTLNEAASGLVEDGTELEAARTALIDLAARAQDEKPINGQTSVTTGDTDNVVKRHESMRDALLHRVRPDLYEATPESREFTGMRLVELARHSLEDNGITHRGLSPGKIAETALHMRHANGAFHTLSDFPLVLADVINKTLRRAYDETSRTFTGWARRTTAMDFRTIHRIQFGEAPALLEVNEHGEFTRGTIGEREETYALSTFGRIVGVTRQIIVNDDLGAFTRLSQLLGAAAARLESDTVYAVLTDNAALSDGIALFAAAASPAGHQNALAAGGVPSVGEISRMRELMRQQVGVDDTTHIDVRPGFIIVPTSIETELEQVLASFQPNVATDVTPASMRSLIPVAEPRLDDTSTDVWYMAADPSQFDTVEYAFLDGEEGVVTEMLNGWDIDGMEVKARLDFAAAAIDHRGLVRNAGV